VPHLQACIADAKREGYMLGVKLVRGAYQSLELSVYEKRVAKGTWFDGSEPPVWTIKSETDETYNKVPINRIPEAPLLTPLHAMSSL